MPVFLPSISETIFDRPGQRRLIHIRCDILLRDTQLNIIGAPLQHIRLCCIRTRLGQLHTVAGSNW